MANLSLLVDTNVWLANYLPTRAGHANARTFLQAAWQQSTTLLYPAPILKDVFYLLGLEYKRQIRSEKGVLSEEDTAVVQELCWGCVHNMRELATAVGIDEADLWLACKYRTLNHDLEDNVVIAATMRSKANYLVTFDQDLIRKAPVPAMLPQDMTALLQMA